MLIPVIPKNQGIARLHRNLTRASCHLQELNLGGKSNNKFNQLILNNFIKEENKIFNLIYQI